MPRTEILEVRALLSNVDIDFSSAFTQDGVRNRSSGTDDNVDDPLDGAGLSRLVTDSFALSRSASGNGLPDNGSFAATAFHPDIQLGYSNADDGNNLALLDTVGSSFTFQVPAGTYDALHVFALSANGPSDMSITLNYLDGTAAGSTQVQDWLLNVTDGTVSGDATRYALIDGMDIVVDTTFEDLNSAAVFGHRFAVDSGRVLNSVSISLGSSGTKLAVLGASASATTFVVDTTEETEDGDFSPGDTSLREALALSNAGTDGAPDVITFSVTGSITLTTELVITDDVMIEGPGAGELSISGGNTTRVFSVDGGGSGLDVELAGLTIRDGGDGTEALRGAGIDNRENLRLRNVSLLNNNSGAAPGGAVSHRQGSITIQDSTISGNTGGNGGGVYVADGSLTLTGSAVSGNTANFGFSGGGLFLAGDSESTIDRTAVSENTSVAGDAGGILLEGSAGLVFVNSELSTNTATGMFGGALRTVGTSSATIINSTVSGNSAVDDGGAIDHSSSGTLTIRNSTITGNRARSADGPGGDGGGIWAGTGKVILHNTIVAGNFEGRGTTPDDLDANADPVSSHNIIGDSSTSGGLAHASNGNIVGNGGAGTLEITSVLNPNLADNGGPTRSHRLVNDGLAVDAGHAAEAVDQDGVPLLVDQRGMPFLRVRDGDDDGIEGVDIGAVESQTEVLVVSANTDIVDADYSTGQFSLREAILVANARSGSDLIRFSPLLARSRIVLSGTPLLVNDDLMIGGLGAMALTIDGDNASRVLEIQPAAAVTISHLTLTQGNTEAAGDGGGVLNRGDLQLREVRLTENSAAGAGGAVFNDGGTLTIVSSELSGNTSSSSGGAISSTESAVVTIVNSTISGNSANGPGGGIDHRGGKTLIRTSTVTGNTSDADASGSEPGGGISVNSGTVTLHNTIVAGNSRDRAADDIAGSVDLDSSFNLVGDAGSAGGLSEGAHGNLVGNGGAGTVDINSVLEPSLSDAGGQTLLHALAADSPAINSGSDAQALDETGAPLVSDQRGVGHPRFAGTTDMGAFERLLGAFDDTADTVSNAPVIIDVLDNDTPATGVEVSPIPNPSNGTVTPEPDGSLKYTPDAGFAGQDRFTYSVRLQQSKLGPGQVPADSDFGHSVAVAGDWMVVGGISEDQPSEDGGTAIVYRRDGGNWTHHQTIDAPDEVPRDRYGYAVAISGTTIVVTARMDDDRGFNSGSAWVWEYDASRDRWFPADKLLDPLGFTRDQFGHSAAIDGDTILIGARLADRRGTNSGAALVFRRAVAGWTLARRIKAGDAAGGDQFGFAVALHGDTAIVTARKDDDAGRDSGAAYILHRNKGGEDNWGEVAKIVASAGKVNDWFGYSAAIDGDKVVVGKPIRNGRKRPGQVHVFERDHGGQDNWGETTIVQSSEATPETDQFGYAVSLSSDRLLVGARRDDSAAGNAGSACLFSRDAGGADNWGEIDCFTATDAAQGDNNGTAVALDRETVAAGAPAHSQRMGAVYVNDLRVRTATVGVDVSAPLLSGSGIGPGSDSLSQATLDVVVSLATKAWHSRAALTPAQASALARTQVVVAPLEGILLGTYSSGHIIIDADGAGHGWWVEANRSEEVPAERMDLLTAVAHELGHALGLSDLYDSQRRGDLMYYELAVGEHRAPGLRDLVFQHLVEEDEPLFEPTG